METPICDFVENYIKKNSGRLHMPGHKGRKRLGWEPYDITEVEGADVLSQATGIIRRSEENATTLFGSRHSFYSTGGSSQCIGAMLYLAYQQWNKTGERPVVLAGRNAHKAFLHGCALLDLDVSWMYPKEIGNLCACPITPEDLEEALAAMEEKPMAVYVTSPDYLGGRLDIKGLSVICRQRGILFLVDNAHGAYLKFLSQAAHPMDLGADLCCDSAHKTLPVLTGGAYLHVGKNAPVFHEEEVRSALALFGSTSPSYLILQSLDYCNRILAEGYAVRLAQCIQRLEQIKKIFLNRGMAVKESEALKLVLDTTKMGYTGREIMEYLEGKGIQGEYADEDNLVLMVSPENTEMDFLCLEKALLALPLGTAKTWIPAPILRGERVMSIRQGMLARQRKVPVAEAVGKICGGGAVSCPPAIPIALSGERITKEMVAQFQRNGIVFVQTVWE